MSAAPIILEREVSANYPTEKRAKGPTVETLRTRLLATEALYTALHHRHVRVNSPTSHAELMRCRKHVAEAKAALAQAVAS